MRVTEEDTRGWPLTITCTRKHTSAYLTHTSKHATACEHVHMHRQPGKYSDKKRWLFTAFWVRVSAKPTAVSLHTWPGVERWRQLEAAVATQRWKLFREAGVSSKDDLALKWSAKVSVTLHQAFWVFSPSIWQGFLSYLPVTWAFSVTLNASRFSWLLWVLHPLYIYIPQHVTTR